MPFRPTSSTPPAVPIHAVDHTTSTTASGHRGQPDRGQADRGQGDRTDDWRQQAACLGKDPELFFPISSTGAAMKSQIETARSVCNMCGVRQACLAWALSNDIDYGVWGGTSEDERRNGNRSRRLIELTRQPTAPSGEKRRRSK